MPPRAERITYNDVAEICDIIVEANLTPTHSRVHTLLQRGSNTTVLKFIQQWEEESSTKPVRLKRSIARAIEAEIRKEAHRLSHQESVKAQTAIEEAEKQKREVVRLSAEVIHLNTKIKEDAETYAVEIDKLKNHIEVETRENKNLTEKILAREKELISSMSTHSILEAQNQEYRQNIEKAEKKIATLQEDKENTLLTMGKNQATIEALNAQIEREGKAK